jgi:hypothetical protein
MAITLATHATVEVAQLPEGALFGQVEWTPDGKAIAYEAISVAKATTSFLHPFRSERSAAKFGALVSRVQFFTGRFAYCSRDKSPVCSLKTGKLLNRRMSHSA